MSARNDLIIVNDFHAETIACLDEHYNTHHLWELEAEEQKKLIESLQGRCRAAATASWDCNPLLYDLQSLEIVSAFGVGVDGIDRERLAAQSIRLTNTPDVLNDAVADLAIALVLATTRNLIPADRFVRQGQWQDGPFPFGTGLAGKTLGIVGLGRIGEAIAERALPFKLRIAYHNRRRKEVDFDYFDSLEDLAEQSHILLNMLPGGPATSQLIDTTILEALGPEGIFINVGRGSSVDEQALVSALQTGTIAGAGLDVYANEPAVPEELFELDNVVLLPHIGSATTETRREMGRLVIGNLEAFFDGKALVTEA